MQNLKTKLLTTLFLHSFPCFHTMAQQSEGADEKRKLIRTELRVQTSRFAKEFRPYELTSAIGWNITSRFFANLQGEAAVALFKVDGKKDYSTNYTLGWTLDIPSLKTTFAASMHALVQAQSLAKAMPGTTIITTLGWWCTSAKATSGLLAVLVYGTTSRTTTHLKTAHASMQQ